MKALTFKGPAGVALSDVRDPRAAPDEVVVAVRYCGICGTDLRLLRMGVLRSGTILGHEFVGAVLECGSEVDGVAAGVRVAILPHRACGLCGACEADDEVGCRTYAKLGLGDDPGGFANAVAVPARSLMALPDHVTDRVAALIEPLAIALRVAARAEFASGEPLLIIGGGPIGLLTLFACLRRGAGSVIVVEPAPARAALARRLGATLVIDPRRDAISATVRRADGGAPAVVFECSGVAANFATACMAGTRRRQVMIVGISAETAELAPAMIIPREPRVEFLYGYDRSSFAEALAVLATDGGQELGSLITHVVPLRDASPMIDSLHTPHEQGKVLIDCQ